MSRIITTTKCRVQRNKNTASIFGRVIFATLSATWVGFGAYASGIDAGTSSATCDYGTLALYNGSVGLQAEYEPNQINLRWHDGNTVISTAAASNTCEYDNILIVPSAPNRAGYEFRGWHARPSYNFATLSINSNSTAKWAIGLAGNGNDCKYSAGTSLPTNASCSAAGFQDLRALEWKLTYSWGTLYGMAKCSETSGSGGSVSGTVSSTEGSYCWCRATGYTPDGSDVKYGPSSATSWVLHSNSGSTDYCKYICASNCTAVLAGDQTFRRKLFTGQ